MKNSLLHCENLTVGYKKPVLSDVNLDIEAGQFISLLGPNGAGKTTTILMLLGLAEISGGSARVLGYDPSAKPLEIKRRVGYLPENVGFYGDLSAAENLSFVAALNGLEGRAAARAAGNCLEAVSLTYAAGRKVATFSRGMRQRLGLAEVLVKNPRIMILDEPTLGLDPDGIDEILRLIASLAQDRGLSILISSHLLPLVERVAHRAAILKQGRLVAAGTLGELASGAAVKRGAHQAGPGSDSPLSRAYRHYFHKGENDG